MARSTLWGEPGVSMTVDLRIRSTSSSVHAERSRWRTVHEQVFAPLSSAAGAAAGALGSPPSPSPRPRPPKPPHHAPEHRALPDHRRRPDPPRRHRGPRPRRRGPRPRSRRSLRHRQRSTRRPPPAARAAPLNRPEHEHADDCRRPGRHVIRPRASRAPVFALAGLAGLDLTVKGIVQRACDTTPVDLGLLYLRGWPCVWRCPKRA